MIEQKQNEDISFFFFIYPPAFVFYSAVDQCGLACPSRHAKSKFLDRRLSYRDARCSQIYRVPVINVNGPVYINALDVAQHGVYKSCRRDSSREKRKKEITRKRNGGGGQKRERDFLFPCTTGGTRRKKERERRRRRRFRKEELVRFIFVLHRILGSSCDGGTAKRRRKNTIGAAAALFTITSAHRASPIGLGPMQILPGGRAGNKNK